MGQGGENLRCESGVARMLNHARKLSMAHPLVIRHGFAVLLAMLVAAPAAAQTWPARTVRIISPFAPGGGNDTVGRFLAAKFTEQIGGTFVVENRAGSGGLIGTDLVAKSPPDGHTLLISSPEFSINPSMRSKMPYDTF